MNIEKETLVLLRSGALVKVERVDGEALHVRPAVVVTGVPDSGAPEGYDYPLSEVVATVAVTGHCDPVVDAMVSLDRELVSSRILLRDPVFPTRAPWLLSFRSRGIMEVGVTLTALREAVGRWMCQTIEGARAFEVSAGNFDVAHLAAYLQDRHLQVLFSNVGMHGVEVMQMQDVSGVFPVNAILCNVREVERRLAPTGRVEPLVPEDNPDADLSEGLSWDSGRSEVEEILPPLP